MRLLAKDSDKVVLQLITIEMKTSGTLLLESLEPFIGIACSLQVSLPNSVALTENQYYFTCGFSVSISILVSYFA